MSVNLLVEVREHAPADLTPAEVLALVWIAEQSRDEDRWLDNGAFVAARTCFPGSEELARWCHVSETGLRKVFTRLADRGLDVRVQQSTDKKGNPVYAIKGRRMVLRLPVLGDTTGSPSADADTETDENRTLGDTQGSPQAIPQGPLRRYSGVPSGDTTGSPTLDLSPDLSLDVPRSLVHGENRAGHDEDEAPIDFIARCLPRGFQGDERALAEQRIAEHGTKFRILNEIKNRREAEKKEKRHLEGTLR